MGRAEGFGIEELTFARLAAGDTPHDAATGEFTLAVYWLCCAVQYPEQRSAPPWPAHLPPPESPLSFPEPDAYFS